MSEQQTTATSLADLKELVAGTPAESTSNATGSTGPVYVRKVDAQGRSYATGRRKDAVARVWISRGNGTITINDRPASVYFARPVLRMLITQPFLVSDRYQQLDVKCTVKGGGLSGQAGAVRHGISRALVSFEPELRGILKKAGFMTRDPRTVERKKYGKMKARRSFQFSKR